MKQKTGMFIAIDERKESGDIFIVQWHYNRSAGQVGGIRHAEKLIKGIEFPCYLIDLDDKQVIPLNKKAAFQI